MDNPDSLVEFSQSMDRDSGYSTGLTKSMDRDFGYLTGFTGKYGQMPAYSTGLTKSMDISLNRI